MENRDVVKETSAEMRRIMSKDALEQGLVRLPVTVLQEELARKDTAFTQVYKFIVVALQTVAPARPAKRKMVVFQPVQSNVRTTVIASKDTLAVEELVSALREHSVAISQGVQPALFAWTRTAV